MDTTIFLAKMWGPAILAVAIGIFTSRSHYLKLYRDLEKETLAVLLFGMMAIAAGVAQIVVHNTWDTLPEIIVSLLGWGLLLKGVLFALFPKFVDRAGDWEADNKMVPMAGILMIIVGAYLSYIGYFA